MSYAAPVLAAAALLLAPSASTSSSAAPACSSAAARGAIAQTRPRLALLAGEKELIAPRQADRIICFDANGDRRAEMAVSLASGGTAGDVGWLYFAANGGRWRLVGSGSGYKLGLFQSGRRLQVVQPVYRAKDPNCCPTGGFDRTLYRWNGKRLAVARAWHTKTFRPPPAG